MTTYRPTLDEILALKAEQQQRYDDRIQAMRTLWTAELVNDGKLLRKPWEDPNTAPDFNPYDEAGERWFHLDSIYGPHTNILEDISKYVAKRLDEVDRDLISNQLRCDEWKDTGYHYGGVLAV
jgi:hypothetical protein